MIFLIVGPETDSPVTSESVTWHDFVLRELEIVTADNSELGIIRRSFATCFINCFTKANTRIIMNE